MIHVVSGANQHLYARQLDQMFRLRRDPHADDASAEVDPRDAEDAVVYLISVDPWGEVAASLRFNPGPEGWTASRWGAAPAASWLDPGALPRNPQHELMIGVMEFCARHRLDRFMLEADEQLAGRLRTYGWRLHAAGGPWAFEVEADALAVTRQTTGIAQGMLIELDP